MSFGAGVNSTAMVLLLQEKGYKIDEIVFVDTGCEFPETYEYLDYLEEMGWEITKITPYIEKTKSLLEYCFKYKISPLKHLRWCTDKFKIRPMYNYIRPPAIIAKGIDFSEKHRVFPDSHGCLDVHPLIDFKLSREDCIKIIQKHNMKVPIKSGCYICPFMDKKREDFLKNNHRDLWDIRQEVLSFRKQRRNKQLRSYYLD